MTFKYEIASFSNDRKKSTGKLIWGDKKWDAVSGPFDKGTLPIGNYKVDPTKASDEPAEADMYITDAKGKLGYYIPIYADFKTDRDNLAIHPDGGDPGTHGCVGISASQARDFINEWKKIPVNKRPTVMVVEEKVVQPHSPEVS